MPIQISVIIPVLNEADTIEPCLRHLEPQQPHETLVVDGHSSDDTVERAQRSGATVFTAPAGRASQLNCGASRASGDVLLFLHADCRLPADGLRQLADCVSDGGSAGSFRHRIDGPHWAYRVIEWGDHLRQRWLRGPYGDQGIFVRAELFERLGGFPEVALMEDVRFVRRLRRETRLSVLAGPLLTSARRWQRRGILRQFLLNQYLLAAERLGVSPDRLAKHY